MIYSGFSEWPLNEKYEAEFVVSVNGIKAASQRFSITVRPCLDSTYPWTSVSDNSDLTYKFGSYSWVATAELPAYTNGDLC